MVAKGRSGNAYGLVEMCKDLFPPLQRTGIFASLYYY